VVVVLITTQPALRVLPVKELLVGMVNIIQTLQPVVAVVVAQQA
jgi:hypothetical protein